MSDLMPSSPESCAELEQLWAKVKELEAQCAATQAANDRYHALLSRVQRVHRSAGLLFWDCDGDNLSWRASDSTSAEWFGLSPDGVPSTERDLLSLVHPADRERVERVYACNHDANTDFEVAYRLQLPDGSVRFIHEFGVANDEVSVDYPHSGSMQNVTESTLAGLERERLNRELEQFTYTVSHELKTPLITVRVFLALLEQDLADKDVSRIQEDMDKIRVATTDMKRVVEDLLHLSQIGGSDNPVSDIPFNDVIDDIEERHQERIFDLFQKPDADRAGTSVGLALSKKNVEMHGGRLWVESEGKGCGSRFCFSLPASEQTAGAPG